MRGCGECNPCKFEQCYRLLGKEHSKGSSLRAQLKKHSSVVDSHFVLIINMKLEVNVNRRDGMFSGVYW